MPPLPTAFEKKRSSNVLDLRNAFDAFERLRTPNNGSGKAERLELHRLQHELTAAADSTQRKAKEQYLIERSTQALLRAKRPIPSDLRLRQTYEAWTWSTNKAIASLLSGAYQRDQAYLGLLEEDSVRCLKQIEAVAGDAGKAVHEIVVKLAGVGNKFAEWRTEARKLGYNTQEQAQDIIMLNAALRTLVIRECLRAHKHTLKQLGTNFARVSQRTLDRYELNVLV